MEQVTIGKAPGRRVSCVLGLAIVALLTAGAFFWMERTMDDVMFVPKPRDTVRIQSLVKPILGDAADTVRVVRVDRDTNGVFFCMGSGSLGRAELLRKLDEAGWDTSKSPTDRVVARRKDGRRIEIIVLEAFDESELYCGYDPDEEDHFWRRFEENRQYMVGR